MLFLLGTEQSATNLGGRLWRWGGVKSLWACWPQLARRIATCDELLLLLDYDGTLTPIAEHPSQVHLEEAARDILKGLAHMPGVFVGLISGRQLSDLKASVKLKGLCYVGNHGLELEGPQIRFTNPAAQASRPVIRKIAESLHRALRKIPGAWVEDKKLTLSVHYRAVPPAKMISLKNSFYETLHPYLEKRKVSVRAGKKVFEVHPPVRWDKGKIVSWLLARRLATARGGDVLPIYMGDDLTDEDAFEALKAQGITVAVGPTSPVSSARYSVRSCHEVQRFLQSVLATRHAHAG